MVKMDFNKAVIEKSFEKPVVVDFWAPWCGPCRVLGPIIEQLAEEQSDRWTLVKLNTEEEYEVAETYRIRSIPTVKMFHRGEVVAEFSGALPRKMIQDWLDENLPDERKGEFDEFRKALEGEVDERTLERLIDFAEANPDITEAAVTAAQRLVFTEPERAKSLIQNIHMGDKFFDEAEDVRQLADFMTLERTDDPAGRALEAASDALKKGDLETAAQKLIEATSIDKTYQNDMPRKTAIAFFRSLGEKHPLTKNYRWKFDMALY